MKNERKKMIYDGDPGHDDAMAILMAAGNPNIDLIGITTVAGNATLEMTTKNALMLMDLIDQDIPVAAGCDRPMVRPLYTAPMVHGVSGMEGAKLFEPKRKAIDKHACDFLIDTLMASDGDINIVAAGPLTNIGMAMRRQPAIAGKIKQLLIMGGGRFGNITPAAEFNIWADAEAAKVVFESGVPIVMCGLDLTYQAYADGKIINEIRAIGSEIAVFVADFLDFYANGSSEAKKRAQTGDRRAGRCSINDACCVAYLIDENAFTVAHRRVDVETKGEFTYGMTCVDVYRMYSGTPLRDPNAYVGEVLNFDLFWKIMMSSLKNL